MKIRLIENDVNGGEYKFKPTNRTPETPMGTHVNNDIKKQNAIRGLSEIDINLSEEEKSRKKKIFKLAKMEALVHNDDKLSSIFKKILEDNPEEKYGYHWNETVMNILFNDYVLNNSVYFEKYKNAIPVEKKRRDKSAINALMKDDGEKESDSGDMKIAAESVDGNGGWTANAAQAFLKQIGQTRIMPLSNGTDISSDGPMGRVLAKLENGNIYLMFIDRVSMDSIIHTISSAGYQTEDVTGNNKFHVLLIKPKSTMGEMNIDEINLFGGGSFDTSQWFVKPQEFQPNDLLVFNKKTGSLMDILSHANLAQQLPKYKSLVNQGIEIVDPKGTTAQNLKVILSKYKVPREIVNTLKTILAQKPQGQISASLEENGEAKVTDIPIEETTTSASSGQYSQPAIWAKDKKNMRFARKPAWSGGQIVGESYITDPACFAKYLKALEIDDFLNETYDMAEAAFAEHGSGMSDIERQSLVKALKNVLTNAMKRMGLEPEEYRQNFLTVIEDIKKELNAVDPNAMNNDQNLKENHLDSRDEKIDFIMQNQPYRDRAQLEKEDDNEIQAIYNTIESEKETHWLAQEESIQENNNDQQVYNAITKELQQPMNELNLDEYSFDDDNMHFSDIATRGAQNKIRLDKLVQFAKSRPTIDQITAFASGFGMAPERLLQLAQTYLGNNLGYSGGSYDTPEQEALMNLIATIEDAQPEEPIAEPVAPATEPIGESMLDQPETSISMGGNQSMSMKNKDGDSGMSMGANVDDISYKQPSTLSVSTTDGGEDLTMQSSIAENEPIDKDLAQLARNANDSRNSPNVQRAAAELANMSNSVDEMIGNLNNIKAKFDISSSDDITNIIDLAASKIKQKGMGNSMNENKKHPSQTNLDRIKKENEKNTKQHEKQADGLDNKKVYGFDPASAGTKDIIKAAQYPADKDFYIKDETDEVSFEDLENAAEKVGKTGIGPDKQVKRILTPEEEKALAMNRGEGMQDIVYDNKPSERFEDRMKDDMGEDQYKIRLDKMKMKAGMPMYNKETQPTSGARADNKFKHKYNMEDMNETLSASYYDKLGKRQIVEFKIQNVKSVDVIDNTFIKLEMSGFGNSFTNIVKENYALKNALSDHVFYIKESQIFKLKNSATQVNESKNTTPQVDDKFKKMMHLINYNPGKYVKK